MAGYGGYKGVQAVQNKLSGSIAGKTAAQIGGAVGSVANDAGKGIYNGVGSAWDLIKSKLAKPAIGSLESAALSSKGKLIELAARCAK